MPREAVNVALRAGPVVLPGAAAVDGAHQPTELDPDEQQARLVRARRDPADVRCPRSRREAPGRPRRELEERVERLPRAAPVAAREQTARLGACVDRAVRRAHREREHARLGQLAVDPCPAAVVAPPYAALAEPGEDSVGRVRVDREALRAAPGERPRRNPRAVPSPPDGRSRPGRSEQAPHLDSVGRVSRAVKESRPAAVQPDDERRLRAQLVLSPHGACDCERPCRHRRGRPEPHGADLRRRLAAVGLSLPDSDR